MLENRWHTKHIQMIFKAQIKQLSCNWITPEAAGPLQQALTIKQLSCVVSVCFPSCCFFGTTLKTSPPPGKLPPQETPTEKLNEFSSLILLFPLWNSNEKTAFSYANKNAVFHKARRSSLPSARLPSEVKRVSPVKREPRGRLSRRSPASSRRPAGKAQRSSGYLLEERRHRFSLRGRDALHPFRRLHADYLRG